MAPHHAICVEASLRAPTMAMASAAMIWFASARKPEATALAGTTSYCNNKCNQKNLSKMLAQESQLCTHMFADAQSF